MWRRPLRKRQFCAAQEKGPDESSPIGPFAAVCRVLAQEGRFIWQLVGVLET